MHRVNKVLEKLRRGEPVLAGTPTPFADAKLTEMIGLCGFDCVWIDWEHQDITDHDIFHMCLGARAAGCEPMVRIRRSDYWSYFRPLEMGATAILVPHVMNADDARWVVRNSRFAPAGLRGMDGAEAACDYYMRDMREYMQWANENIIVGVQIEDREAVETIDEIAAVEGIDLLFVGPGDLSQSYGIPTQMDSPLIREAKERVAAAAKANGKWWGSTSASAEATQELLAQGALFIVWGAAVILLADGYRSIKAQFEALHTPAESD